MGIASDSLELIRRVFRRDQMIPGVPMATDMLTTTPTRGMSMGGSSALGVLSGGVSTHMSDALSIEGDLVSRYEDYSLMDSYPEISTALDLFADDATVGDVLDGKALWYEAPDNAVQEILNTMLVKQLRVEEDLWDIARKTCSMGNNFGEIVAVDGVGVVELRQIYVPATRRIQDDENTLYGYVFDPNLAFTVTTDEFFRRLRNRQVDDDWRRREMGLMNSDMTRVYEPWEVVHFRMRSTDAADLYGVSIVDAARYAWRRLMMMEDAMMVYKLTRSPQRYAFYVDVGDAPPREAKRLLQQVKNEFKKTKFVDASGKVNFHYNPLSADEDLFMATRKDKRSTEVEVLSGPEGQQTDDVEYFKEKLIASLKVPKSYLAGDDTVGRANLAQLDVRMARSVMRIQRVIKNGFEQVARVDLAARNIDPDVVEYRTMMNVPSGVLEMAQMEVATAKMDLGDRYRNAGFSDYWINSKILGMSDDEIAMAKGAQEGQGGAELSSESRAKIRGDVERDRLLTAARLNERKAAAALTEIRSGQTETANRLKELRLLVSEVKRSLPKRKYRRK